MFSLCPVISHAPREPERLGQVAVHLGVNLQRRLSRCPCVPLKAEKLGPCLRRHWALLFPRPLSAQRTSSHLGTEPATHPDFVALGTEEVPHS